MRAVHVCVCASVCMRVCVCVSCLEGGDQRHPRTEAGRGRVAIF